MANPQKENGYTPIANEVLEKIYSLKLSATQFRILMVVWRYTYGFSRKSHDLSESFISKAIDVSKRYVSDEIKRLIDMKLLVVIKESTFTEARIIAFNKNYDEWNSGTKEQQVNNSSTAEQNQDTTVEQSITSTDEQLFHQDKQSLKQNLKQNIIISSDEQQIFDVLSSVKDYPLDTQKDLAMVNHLKENYPQVDLIPTLNDWAIYKLDHPLKPKDSPRNQINTWFKKSIEFNKKVKISKGQAKTRNRSPGKKEDKYKDVYMS